MTPIPPPCPPNGKDNFYHLTTNPQDPLILRVIRTIGYILLHIITFGLLLLIHYYKHHQAPRKGLPTPPTPPIEPDRKTIEIAKQPTGSPDDKKPPSKPESPVPPTVEVATPPPILPASKDYQSCLNRMVEMVMRREHLPLASIQIDPNTGGINPEFIASYPNQVEREQMYFHVERLRETLRDPHCTPQQQRLAQLSLQQIEYLNTNYYIASVPGDGNCFYRAYAIGWLCALCRECEINGAAFEDEAIRVLTLPFAASSTINENLCSEIAGLLQLCGTYPTLTDVYNKVILSPQHTRTLITFLQKLSVYAARREIAASIPEETARAIYISNLEDELLPKALESLFASRPCSELFQNFIDHTALPHMQSNDELLLLLEHLPALFLTEEELNRLSPEAQAGRRQYENEIQRAFSELSAHIAASGWNDIRFNATIKDRLPEGIKSQYKRFLANMEHRRAHHRPWSSAFSFFAFLRTCPSTMLDQHCADFHQEVEWLVNGFVPPQKSIQDVLKISTGSLRYLTADIDSSWQRSVLASNLFTLLTTHKSLQSESSIPQLETLHTRIANVLKKVLSTAFKTAPLSDHPDLLKNMVEKLLFTISNTQELKQHFDKVCSARSLSSMRHLSDLTPEEDLLYTQAVQLLFFILQHPQVETRRETKDAVKDLKMLLLPFLQYTFKKVENEIKLKKLLGSILGSILLNPPANYPSIPTNEDLLTFFKFFSKHPEVMVLDPILEKNCLNFIQKVFPNTKLENEAKLLIKEFPNTFGNLWKAFLKRVNILGTKLGSHQSETPLSDLFSKSFLIFCFLTNYPHLLHKNTTLTAQLKSFQKEAQDRFVQGQKELLHMLRHGFALVGETINLYSEARKQLLYNLLRKTEIKRDGFCRSAFRRAFIGYLHSLDSTVLADVLDEVKEQAEANDVSVMTTVPLQRLAVCQAVSDLDAVSEEVMQNFIVRHGFLNTFSPEGEASIFLIRFPNHYGCLLPRNPRTEAQNLETNLLNP
ncbi:hypothetical protein [Candidatus Chlamydia corallus]|uniref:hypothetical protein n=1 Tax=Candidatus Chlamydia corallus TaxID=2038470 RepID=UPI000C2F8A7A|nr:hypothetical protein [Candidatus Chlamydia corallus]